MRPSQATISSKREKYNTQVYWKHDKMFKKNEVRMVSFIIFKKSYKKKTYIEINIGM